MNDPKNPKRSVVSMGTTAQAFNAKLQFHKKQIQSAADVAEQEKKRRHSTLLRGMTETRRALAEISKVDLGGTFFLELDVDDWQGWPRVMLRLVNGKNPIKEYPGLTVCAHDRKDSGTIEIYVGGKPTPITHQMLDPDSEGRYPVILRRAARSYLDEVCKLVLAAETEEGDAAEPELNLGATLKKKEGKDKDPLSSVDLFVGEETKEVFEKASISPNDSFLEQGKADFFVSRPKPK